MCVIVIARTTRPAENMIEACYEANNAGAGIAWRDGGKVKWSKGLTVGEIQDLCKTVPLPYVAHFRIPTCGGPTKEMCHPFPIDPRTTLQLKGSTEGFVLFHNGHWADYKKVAFESAVKGKIKIPPGRWSDSRAMAWVASLYGLGALDFIDEKVCAFGPNQGDLQIYGNGWSTTEEGLLVSNEFWKARRGTFHGGVGYVDRGATNFPGETYQERQARITKLIGDGKDHSHDRPVTPVVMGPKGQPGGVAHPATFCRSLNPLQPGGDVQEEVQASPQGVAEGHAGDHHEDRGAAGGDEVHHTLSGQWSPGARILQWWNEKHPKRYHGGTPVPNGRYWESEDLEQRIAQARGGISRVLL